jgi:hypothetical protein
MLTAQTHLGKDGSNNTEREALQTSGPENNKVSIRFIRDVPGHGFKKDDIAEFVKAEAEIIVTEGDASYIENTPENLTVFSCPECGLIVEFHHKDDLQQWFICGNGHQNPENLLKKEVREQKKEFKVDVKALEKAAEIQAEQNEEPFPAQFKKVLTEEIQGYLNDGWKITKEFKEFCFMEKAATNPQTTPEENKPLESQQDRLIKYCLEETTELFYDQHGTPYARVKMDLRYCDIYDVPHSTQPCSIFISDKQGEERLDNYKEQPQIPQYRNPDPQTSIEKKQRYVTVPIRSPYFKRWLAYLMYEREQKAPGGEAVSSASTVLMGKAQKEGKEYELFNRIAPLEDGILIDLCDENWRAIKVTKEGWEILDNPPIKFRRYKHQKPLCEPIRAATEADAATNALKLLDHVNIKNEAEDKFTRLAVVCTVISYLIPLIAHPIMVIYGPQGAAKSYLHKLVRRTIDPSSTEILTLPHDDNEIIQQLDHNWLCFYDNLTYLPSSASDIFCRAATGSGFSKRELYSDDDDVIYSFKRCVGLNGINPAARKGDLLDRSMLVAVTKIDVKDRKTEAEVDAEFEKDKALILGGFLSVLSLALRKYDDVKLEGYQRLADFHRYGCAIALALGRTAEDFTQAYESKVESQTDEALNAEPVGIAMLSFCERYFALDGKKHPLHEKWEGTPALLYQQVTAHAESLGIRTDNHSHWPKAPNAFSRKLNEIIPPLMSKNFEIIVKEGTPRQIIITYGTQTKLPIALEPPTPQEEVLAFCSILEEVLGY